MELKRVGFRPLNYDLLLKVIKEDNVTESGIILTTDADAKPKAHKALVIATGAKVLDARAGNIVYVSKHYGSDIKINGEDHVVLHEKYLLGVFE